MTAPATFSSSNMSTGTHGTDAASSRYSLLPPPHFLFGHVLNAFFMLCLRLPVLLLCRNALRESEEEKERLLKRIEDLKDDIDMYQAEAIKALQERLTAAPQKPCVLGPACSAVQA